MRFHYFIVRKMVVIVSGQTISGVEELSWTEQGIDAQRRKKSSSS